MTAEYLEQITKARTRRQRIADMKAAGMKGKVIAEKLGICPQRVSQLIKAHEAAKARGEAA
jgi:DNA-binding NarL/FixJ family response regulator